MNADEQSISRLIEDWMRATREGDLPRILEMMDPDVVFLVAGQPPMRGRQAFAEAFAQFSPRVRIDPTSEIQEIQILGDWAYCWNRISMAIMPRNAGDTARRSGNVLSIFRKQSDGRWAIYRDANMLAPESLDSR